MSAKDIPIKFAEPFQLESFLVPANIKVPQNLPISSKINKTIALPRRNPDATGNDRFPS